MKINRKVMFLNLEQGKTKDNREYTRIKCLDKEENDLLYLYTNNKEKYSKFKPYEEINIILNIYKDSKNIIRMGLVENE